MLKVVEYIKQYGLQHLIDQYHIKTNRHKDYPNLVLLKYDQLNTPKNDITNECRGIILDEANDWAVVNYSYSRFFNASETNAAPVDFNNARIYEKLDGSLIQFYYFNGKWQVATSGTCDASGQVYGFDFTFAELFWRIWGELNYKLPTNTNICYALEMTSPFNKIVVPYDKNDLVLHGARRLSDFKELNPIIEAHNNGWHCVKTFPLQTLDDVVAAAKQLNALDGEGFVVCDYQYRRIKVKAPDYLIASRLKDSTCSSDRQLVEKVRLNDQAEFLVYFPHLKERYYDIKAQYERVLGRIEGAYSMLANITDKKQFALMATRSKYSGALFAQFNGKTNNFKEYLAEMNIKTLEEWLDE